MNYSTPSFPVLHHLPELAFCKLSFIKDNSVALADSSGCVCVCEREREKERRFFFSTAVFLSPSNFCQNGHCANQIESSENLSSGSLDSSEEREVVLDNVSAP